MTLKEVAEIQRIYSQLYLSGHVGEDVYRAVVNATMLDMNGFNEIALGIIATDMRKLGQITELLPSIQEKFKVVSEPTND